MCKSSSFGRFAPLASLKDLRDNGALANAHAENLALLIPLIPLRRIMLGCDEDGLAGDIKTVAMDEINLKLFVTKKTMPCFFETCITTGKSFAAFIGRNISIAFAWKTGSAAWWSISTTCSWEGGGREI